MSDCEVDDSNDNVQLLSNRKYPEVLVKLQRYRECRHVAEEMEQEAMVYRNLTSSRSFIATNATPSFHGFCTRDGVAMLCLGREGDDFDDIGIENISMPLKLSAVRAESSGCQRRWRPTWRRCIEERCPKQGESRHAKIIDFGRARFSKDKRALREQVQELKDMLGV